MLGYELYFVPNVIGQQLKDTVTFKEVEITDSKIPKRSLESPITITKMDPKIINALPQENIYAGLSSQKGVDIITSSLFYQFVNLRGPSNPLSESVLQLVDGMDNTPPGQGFLVGNLAGVSDLDVENVEIIPGSSSAIYGANAFSGLINITTKNPFLYQGLSVQFKNGATYIDGKDHSPAFFSDYQIRYAKVFKKRFAVKFNFSYQQGANWLFLDQTDFDRTAAGEDRGLDNPGREIHNIYGDEIQQALPIGTNGNDVNVSRTGYDANVIFETKSLILKPGISFHYKVSKETELSYSFNYSIFNTTVTPATWNFKNFSVTYHKLELKNKNYFLRLYSLKDHDGNSVDGQLLAQLMNNKWKSDSVWFNDYTNAYNGNVSGVTQHDHNIARNYADIGRPLPGSEMYNQLYSEFSETLINFGGARYADESDLYHLHGQYDFSSSFHWMKIIVGIEARSRNLASDSVLFLEPPPEYSINTKSYGTYVQCEKELFKNKLSVLASLRLDKSDVFSVSIAPRFALVYKPDEKNFFRASFQSGSRSPDPYDEYRSYVDQNTFIIGGVPLFYEKYQLHERAFDINSAFDFYDHAQSYLDQYGSDSTDAAISLYKDLLKPENLHSIQPEKVQTIEIGYQCLLLNNKLHIDIDFFGSIYDEMISYKWVTEAAEGNPYHPDSLNAAAASFLNNDFLYFEIPVNATQPVRSGGVEASVEYNFWKDYTVSGNFIFQKSKFDPEVNTWLFMTTPLKTNLAISNPKFYKNLGFSINWHWNDAMGQYWKDDDPYVNNRLNANSVIDGQITLSLSKMHSSIRLGASNLLNHYYQNLPNGCTVGGVYYISILYEVR